MNKKGEETIISVILGLGALVVFGIIVYFWGKSRGWW